VPHSDPSRQCEGTYFVPCRRLTCTPFTDPVGHGQHAMGLGGLGSFATGSHIVGSPPFFLHLLASAPFSPAHTISLSPQASLAKSTPSDLEYSKCSVRHSLKTSTLDISASRPAPCASSTHIALLAAQKSRPASRTPTDTTNPSKQRARTKRRVTTPEPGQEKESEDLI